MPDQTLTSGEAADLRCLAALMIPASARHGVPGADEATIFADILASLERDFADVRKALAQLATLSGGRFADLAPDRCAPVAADFKAAGGAPLAALNRVVLLCYYRDDRVMRSLNQEPRPPFPKGHDLEQGDWSLLDRIRERKPFWRAAP